MHALRPGAGIRALNQGRLALEGVAWTGIALVMITGVVNLILRSQATGAHLGRTYMILLAIKLFLFVAMLAHHILQVFDLDPRISPRSAPQQPVTSPNGRSRCAHGKNGLCC